jgi:hypothetical protein
MRPILAGAAYFLIVFTIAFVLGALRVMFVVPAVGEVLATLGELPFMLAASWVTSAWLLRHWRMPSMATSAVMGISAFALLMVAEAVGGILIFDRTLSAFVSSFGTAAGALGLAGQVAFALIPVAQYFRLKQSNLIQD